MINTILGRLQTKVITYPLLGLVTVFFVWHGGPVYWWAAAVTMLVGLVLETIWGVLLTYQPGWLTFLFGLIEFLAVVNITLLMDVSMSLHSATIYYLCVWLVIQAFLIYFLPIFRLSWSEDGGELW